MPLLVALKPLSWAKEGKGSVQRAQNIVLAGMCLCRDGAALPGEDGSGCSGCCGSQAPQTLRKLFLCRKGKFWVGNHPLCLQSLTWVNGSGLQKNRAANWVWEQEDEVEVLEIPQTGI